MLMSSATATNDAIDFYLEKWRTAVENPKPKAKIRITFNRKLTWSEREALRAFVVEQDGLRTKFDTDGRLVAEDFYSDDSRDLCQLFQDFVATEFLNVHPKAVFTIIPEVRV